MTGKVLPDPGDRVHITAEGIDREFVVISEPGFAADGTLTFEVADPDAHERCNRLRKLLNLPANGATR